MIFAKKIENPHFIRELRELRKVMLKEYCVYMHTNKINNKKYIGITSKNPLYRWNNGHGYKGQIVFYRAIVKYGWDNFSHEILFTGLSEDEARAKEIELIAKHKTNYKRYGKDFGYNACDGGDISPNTGNSYSKYINKIIKGFKVIGHCEKRVSLECQNCGAIIDRSYSVLLAESNIKCKCNYKPKKRYVYEHICEHCGKSYTAKDKGQKYCSPECAHKANGIKKSGIKRVEQRKCEICGKPFYPKTHKSKQIYCSRECQYESMRKENPAKIEKGEITPKIP